MFTDVCTALLALGARPVPASVRLRVRESAHWRLPAPPCPVGERPRGSEAWDGSAGGTLTEHCPHQPPAEHCPHPCFQQVVVSELQMLPMTRGPVVTYSNFTLDLTSQ